MIVILMLDKNVSYKSSLLLRASRPELADLLDKLRNEFVELAVDDHFHLFDEKFGFVAGNAIYRIE